MAENPLTQLVYVIKATTGVVKIGVSLDPASRLKTFVTGNPHGLTLEYSESFPFDAAAAIEKMVHGLLAEYKENGEWFRVDVEKAIATIKLAAVAVEKCRAEMYIKAMNDTPEKIKTVYVDKLVHVDRIVNVPVEKIVHIPVREFNLPYITLSSISVLSLSTGCFLLGVRTNFYIENNVSMFDKIKEAPFGPDATVAMLIVSGVVWWAMIGIDTWIARGKALYARLRQQAPVPVATGES